MNCYQNFNIFLGERAGDLSFSPVYGSRVPLMEVDFTDSEALRQIVNKPEEKTIELTLEGDANSIIVTFELDLDEEITIGNEIGSVGCWEQAIYPLTQNCGPKVNATFRLECDGPILLNVDQEVARVQAFVPGRQISAYNRRAAEIGDLFKENRFVVWYTANADFDLIAEAVKANKQLFIVYHSEKQVEKFNQLQSLLGPNKVKSVKITPEFLLSLPDVDPIPFYVNFLDEYQLTNWPMMDQYLSGKIGHPELGIDDINLTVSIQLCHSKWLEGRVLLDDKNLPENIEIANHLNSLQLVSYPEFDTWKNHHDSLSDIHTRTLCLNPQNRIVKFSVSIDFDQPLTSVRYWMKIEHRKLALTTQKCHFVIAGISSPAPKSSFTVETNIVLENASYCPDNCGISFEVK